MRHDAPFTGSGRNPKSEGVVSAAATSDSGDPEDRRKGTNGEGGKEDPVREVAYHEHVPTEEPFYVPVGDEVEIFRAAYRARLPVSLKGPTGCGKTRFLEYMSWTLGREEGEPLPLITVACHEDLTASDLVGRYILVGEETVWMDGPLTAAVKAGAICYLDEVVEARKDTLVLIHPLADHRRILPLEKKGCLVRAHPRFLLVISYNPGYQSMLKDLKISTRQRFAAIDFTYPPPAVEARIIAGEAGVDEDLARELARLGELARNLGEPGMEEGPSTRLLIYAARLIGQGVEPRRACETALVSALSDDPVVQQAVRDLVATVFP
ncbi:CbbQ/NirQ/NorQ/GpvN family protein [Candidatus Solincola tengchongensis]|uniref:CbbQ/NirQ/NorQ/GpvN family protein n=1 Tax=Candidatus Solincola tengchongensis TaxID=2900693 RepID=UPI002580639F|nr:CbbQ/NirQ/NorQ/GpvN family protein [Candidatus Solincola tengchongensis]